MATVGELRHDRPRAATAVGPLPLNPPSAGGGGAVKGGAGTEEEEHGFGADELLHGKAVFFLSMHLPSPSLTFSLCPQIGPCLRWRGHGMCDGAAP
jgi:hypothetical protein